MKEIFYALFIEKLGYLSHRIYNNKGPEWFFLPDGEAFKLKNVYLIRSKKSKMIRDALNYLERNEVKKFDLQLHKMLLTDEVTPTENNYTYVFKYENKYRCYYGNGMTDWVEYLFLENLDSSTQNNDEITSIIEMNDYDYNNFYIKNNRHKEEWEKGVDLTPTKIALILDKVEGNYPRLATFFR